MKTFKAIATALVCMLAVPAAATTLNDVKSSATNTLHAANNYAASKVADAKTAAYKANQLALRCTPKQRGLYAAGTVVVVGAGVYAASYLLIPSSTALFPEAVATAGSTAAVVLADGRTYVRLPLKVAMERGMISAAELKRVQHISASLFTMISVPIGIAIANVQDYMVCDA